MSRPPFSLRLDAGRLCRLDQAAERERIRRSEFVRRAPDERIERVLGEPSALDYLSDYIGAAPGTIGEILDERTTPEDDFGAALVDDYKRQLAGRGKREWRLLNPVQKAAALEAARAQDLDAGGVNSLPDVPEGDPG